MLRTGLAETKRKKFMSLAFGDDFLEELKKRGLKTRDLFEWSSPTTQCNNVIGECDQNSYCWLCGYKIFLGENGRDVTTREEIAPEFYPECEHVLPVMPAVLIFGGLYSTPLFSDEQVFFREYIEPLLKLEYKWSHSICNGIKDEDMFFDDKGDFDETSTRIYLGKIHDKSNLIKTFSKKPIFINNRVEKIQEVLEPIMRFYKQHSSNLNLLASVGTAVNTVTNDIPRLLSDKSKVKQFILEYSPENIRIVKPTYLIDHIETESESFVKQSFLDALRDLPIFFLTEYIKVDILTNKRGFISDVLEFYNRLFHTDHLRIQSITEIDIKYAIVKYYFISPEDTLQIDFYISVEKKTIHSAQPYWIEIITFIYLYKLSFKIDELENDEVFIDTKFKQIIETKLIVILEVLLKDTSKMLTVRILKYLGFYDNIKMKFELNNEVLPDYVEDYTDDIYDNITVKLLSSIGRNSGGFTPFLI
jgi:hypothetical protein